MKRRSLLAAFGAAFGGAACKRSRPVLVGALDGREPRLLGEILAQLIEGRLSGGAVRRFEMGRTQALHQAMMMGEIEVCTESTAAAHAEILKAAPAADASVVFERVKLDYQNQFQMEWFAPLGFDASFVLVVAAEDARFQSVDTISALAARKILVRLAATPSFMNRADGSASMIKTYELPVRLYTQARDETAPLYRVLADRRVDVIAGTASDGALADSRWKVLADDKSAFLPARACVVARADVLARRPELRELLGRLSGKIPNDVIRRLNRDVNSGRDTAAVASAFLASARLG